MSLAFGEHIIAGLALNGSAVSACYNGQIVWPDVQMCQVNLSNNNDYLRMRFVDATGGETAIEVGSGATATASASVPVGATAYWSANGCSTGADTRYHVTAIGVSGFGDISADTAAPPAFYTVGSLISRGSARLIATDSASAQVETTPVYHVTYGEGSTNYYSTVSASSWAGEVTGTWDYKTGRGMWIPSGAQVGFSGSSNATRTYDVQTNMTALDGYAISYNHAGNGTRSLVTGILTQSGPMSFRLANGRLKSVYATGNALQIAAASGAASATTWRAHTIMTAFSSNLRYDSSTSYITGSANAGAVHGFTKTKTLGQMKNSAGTWNYVSGLTDVYNFKYITSFSSMSGTMSGNFSAMRTEGPTGNNNATYILYGYTDASGSYSLKSGTFAAPTASGKTATTIQTVSTAITANRVNVCNMFHVTVPQTTSLISNCKGAWTASGVVL